MYAERASRLPGAVVWRRRTERPAAVPSVLPAPSQRPGPPVLPERPVLPDGCMDLLWTEGRLLVAGPDTHAYVPDGLPAYWAGVRFPPGTAPKLLGVPAHELRDRRVDLVDLWPATQVRRQTARVDAAPDTVTALDAIALDRVADTDPPDPLLTLVVASLNAGHSVTATAEALGVSPRRLHRPHERRSATARKPCPASCGCRGH